MPLISHRKMVGKKKKEPFSGDMFNSLDKTNKEFHQYKSYSWYSYFLVEETYSKHIRTIGLVKVGCIMKVFSVPELVLWCSNHFDATKRVIHVGESNMPPIILTPIIFHKMLRFPKPIKELKIPKEDAFISNNSGPNKLLTYFTNSLSRVKVGAYQFDTNLLKEPYQESAWLFAQATDQDTTTYFPWYILLVLYGTFRMDWNLYLAKIISNEIAHQQGSYQQMEKFFRTTSWFML